ncbi:response regulator [Caballeronia sp. M23-90]|jgi:CheY-like chemotaxis protein
MLSFAMTDPILNNLCQNWSMRRLHSSNAPKRVLVVDDFPAAAEALATFLSLEGLDARVAFGGEEALSQAASWLPDIIILDIHMPRCDGFTTAALLRKEAKSSAIGIVAFTAIDADEVRQRAAVGEFDGYCQKGASPTILLSLLNQMW